MTARACAVGDPAAATVEQRRRGVAGAGPLGAFVEPDPQHSAQPRDHVDGAGLAAVASLAQHTDLAAAGGAGCRRRRGRRPRRCAARVVQQHLVSGGRVLLDGSQPAQLAGGCIQVWLPGGTDLIANAC
jgi:hypothetical protein